MVVGGTENSPFLSDVSANMQRLKLCVSGSFVGTILPPLLRGIQAANWQRWHRAKRRLLLVPRRSFAAEINCHGNGDEYVYLNIQTCINVRKRCQKLHRTTRGKFRKSG